MLSVRETCFLFPPGPGVDWRREAFYGLVVIVDKLSIFCFLLDLGSSGEEKLSIFVPLGPGVGWRRAFYGLVI